MDSWDPPQIGGTTDIPVKANKPAKRWWKRKYRRVPVWGWMVGSLFGLSAVSSAFAPDEGEQLSIVDDAARSAIATDEFADVDQSATDATPATAAPDETPATVVESTEPAATSPVPTTTSAAVASTTTSPAATTTPPTTTIAVTAPPTTTSPAPPEPTVSITTRFNADGDDNQNKNDEWVRFHNNGPAPFDLTGWIVEDEGAKHMYRFGSAVLQPGESVTLFTGCGNDDAFNRFWCSSGSAIWNNDGDVVSLFDAAGALVASQSG